MTTATINLIESQISMLGNMSEEIQQDSERENAVDDICKIADSIANLAMVLATRDSSSSLSQSIDGSSAQITEKLGTIIDNM